MGDIIASTLLLEMQFHNCASRQRAAPELNLPSNPGSSVPYTTTAGALRPEVELGRSAFWVESRPRGRRYLTWSVALESVRDLSASGFHPGFHRLLAGCTSGRFQKAKLTSPCSSRFHVRSIFLSFLSFELA